MLYRIGKPCELTSAVSSPKSLHTSLSTDVPTYVAICKLRYVIFSKGGTLISVFPNLLNLWRKIEQGKHSPIVSEAVACDTHSVTLIVYQTIVNTETDDFTEMLACVLSQYLRYLCQGEPAVIG